MLSNNRRNNHVLRASLLEPSVVSLADQGPTGVIEYTDELPDETLSVIERLGRAAKFYSKAIPVFASYKLLEIKLTNFPLSEEEAVVQWNELHDWGSDVISKAITELKGFYPKTGQIIATRVDIFPEQYTTKLSHTLDDLDPLPAKVLFQ